jgi:hypothetical protein
MVGQVALEQRAEIHERLREADSAATVEQQVRGVASAVFAGQNMASVLLLLPFAPTCIRRPKRRRWSYIALVAARRASREASGVAASSAYSEAQKLKVNSPLFL